MVLYLVLQLQFTSSCMYNCQCAVLNSTPRNRSKKTSEPSIFHSPNYQVLVLSTVEALETRICRDVLSNFDIILIWW